MTSDVVHASFAERLERELQRAGWIPASERPEGFERQMLLWVQSSDWPFSEPVVGWWKPGPGCFAFGELENANTRVTYYMEIPPAPEP
jgi:hypothetical protein